MSGHLDQDLEDYAWGRLNDPQAVQAIERQIAADPDLKARVDELQALKAALHAHYDRALHWPLPERPDPAGRRSPMDIARMAAAGLAIFVVGAVSGAWLGPDGSAWSSPHLQAFEQRALLSSGAFSTMVSLDELAVDDEAPSLGGVVQRLQRLSDQAQEANGLRIDGAQAVNLGHIQGVRVLLHEGNGPAASLFVQPRWTAFNSDVDIVSRDDVSLAIWVDGPFTYGLAAATDRGRLGALADKLRSVLGPRRPHPAPEQMIVNGTPLVQDSSLLAPTGSTVPNAQGNAR